MGKHSYKKKRSSRYSSSSDSSSSSSSSSNSSNSYKLNKHKLNFAKLYDYLRTKLLLDDDFVPCGSDAFGYAYSTLPQTIGIGYAIVFDNNSKLVNVEHVAGSDQVVIRKSGVYRLVFTMTPVQPCQFAIFVNGIIEPSSVTGLNTGANQLIIRQMISFKKDDVITIRNFGSASAIDLSTGAGGITGSTDTAAAQLTLFRFAPYANQVNRINPYANQVNRINPYTNQVDKSINKSINQKNTNQSKEHFKHRHIYDTVIKKLEKDPALALGPDFAAFGSFYRVTSQTIAVDDPIIFERSSNVRNLMFTNNSSDIGIVSDGVYWIQLVVGTDKSVQLTVFVNNVAVPITTVGIDSGATQLIAAEILELKAGDKLSVRNHTSAIGNVTISQNAGGLLQGNNAILILLKESPLISDLDRATFYGYSKSNIGETSKLLNLYNDFKQYLTYKQLALGSLAYYHGYNVAPQVIPLETSMIIYQNQINKNIHHTQATSPIIIDMDGIYFVATTSYANTSAQFTLYINGVPDTTTTTGTDSGAGAYVLAQLIALHKGDVMTIVNHSSAVGAVTLTQNGGGTEVATNTNFNIARLGPLTKTTNVSDSINLLNGRLIDENGNSYNVINGKYRDNSGNIINLPNGRYTDDFGNTIIVADGMFTVLANTTPVRTNMNGTIVRTNGTTGARINGTAAINNTNVRTTVTTANNGNANTRTTGATNTAATTRTNTTATTMNTINGVRTTTNGIR